MYCTAVGFNCNVYCVQDLHIEEQSYAHGKKARVMQFLKLTSNLMVLDAPQVHSSLFCLLKIKLSMYCKAVDFNCNVYLALELHIEEQSYAQGKKASVMQF